MLQEGRQGSHPVARNAESTPDEGQDYRTGQQAELKESANGGHSHLHLYFKCYLGTLFIERFTGGFEG